MNFYNIQIEKLILRITIAFSVFVLICITWYIRSAGSCEIFQTCNYLAAKMEMNRDALFCINETTSALQSLHVYNTHNCKDLLHFDLHQIRHMFNDLRNCFNNEIEMRNKSCPSTEPNCPLEFRNHFTRICFDDRNILSSIRFFDKYLLNPQEAYHLYIYLKLFASTL